MSLELAWSCVDGDHGLRITGWPARERAPLTRLDHHQLAERIVVLPTSLATTPPARSPGRFTADADGVTFVPRFPFLADTAYTVLVHPSLCGGDERGGEPVDVLDYRRFTLAPRRAPAAARTRVVAIHPSTAAVPRNLLRCYVQFSAPMSEGDAAASVHLVDRHRRAPVEGAFLSMDPELWDPARTRLTVLLDPGRIKRGLAPHREAGYALVEGTAVSIVVDHDFRDADGRPLAESAGRDYRVGPDLRGRVDPVTWRIAAPSTGSREPLIVDFGRALDHALLAHCLVVSDLDGHAVAGRAAPGAQEATWSFVPDERWRPVRHDLVVDAMLEDVAGNSVVRVFDRDLDDPTHAPLAASRVTRGFRPTA